MGLILQKVGYLSILVDGRVIEIDPTLGSSCSSNENPADGVGLGEEAEEDVSTLPDNFSDVAPISANVSARGSNASLSGERADTPFSGDAAGAANGVEQQNGAI